MGLTIKSWIKLVHIILGEREGRRWGGDYKLIQSSEMLIKYHEHEHMTFMLD